MSQIKLQMGDMLCLYVGDPWIFFLEFYLNFWPDAQHICGGLWFCLVVMGKELLADLKWANFKSWLDTRPKIETHEPNVYHTILGGVSRGFWSLFLDLGALHAILGLQEALFPLQKDRIVPRHKCVAHPVKNWDKTLKFFRGPPHIDTAYPPLGAFMF